MQARDLRVLAGIWQILERETKTARYSDVPLASDVGLSCVFPALHIMHAESSGAI